MFGEERAKRVVTSAIPGLSVGEVRRHLDYMRHQWTNANTKPFFITESLPNTNLNFQTFALLFIKGQHEKRHKTASKATGKKLER